MTDDDLLSISGIQHFVFCRRQWALIHIEQQWAENVLTVSGELMHQNAHDGTSTENRYKTKVEHFGVKRSLDMEDALIFQCES